MRDEKSGVITKSHLVGLKKITKCFTVKDLLTWVTKNIEFLSQGSVEELNFFVQTLIDRQYIFNAQDRNNEEYDENTKSLFKFREVQPLLKMGRSIKHYFVYSEPDAPKVIKNVMTVVKKTKDSRVIMCEKDGDAFCAFMMNVKHPQLMEIDRCEYDIDLNVAYVYKKFTASGSLRDLIFKAQPLSDYYTKYDTGRGLTTVEISLYGRQILKGIMALQGCGFSFPSLHTGNVLIDGKRFECRFTDLENSFLGKPHPYILEFDPRMSKELQCFGHMLFEMAAGYRLESIEDGMIPTDTGMDPVIYDVLVNIFSARIVIEDLLEDPLFFKKGDIDFKPIYIKDSTMLTMFERIVTSEYKKERPISEHARNSRRMSGWISKETNTQTNTEITNTSTSTGPSVDEDRNHELEQKESFNSQTDKSEPSPPDDERHSILRSKSLEANTMFLNIKKEDPEHQHMAFSPGTKSPISKSPNERVDPKSLLLKLKKKKEEVIDVEEF